MIANHNSRDVAACAVPTPRRVSELDQVIDRLNQDVASCRDALRELFLRIAPLTRDGSPEVACQVNAKDCAPSVMRSEIVERIDDVSRDLRALLADIVYRLEHVDL